MGKQRIRTPAAKSKIRRHPTQVKTHSSSAALDLVDRFEEECAQAMAIASLMMETDADDAVVDSACAIRNLVEQIRENGRALINLTGPASPHKPTT